MKDYFKKYFLTLVALVGLTTLSLAQSYHSVPTALKHLKDEAAFVQHQLDEKLTKGSNESIAASEKLRFINRMIKALDEGKTIEYGMKKLMPKASLAQMQPGLRHFTAVEPGMNSYKYIYTEIMRLVSYE